MRRRGQRLLGTDAICCRIDLRMGFDILTIQLLQRGLLEHVRMIFYAQSIFFQHIAATVCKILFEPLITNSSWKSQVASGLCSMQYCECTWYLLFLIPSSKDGTCLDGNCFYFINANVIIDFPMFVWFFLDSIIDSWSVLFELAVAWELDVATIFHSGFVSHRKIHYTCLRCNNVITLQFRKVANLQV